MEKAKTGIRYVDVGYLWNMINKYADDPYEVEKFLRKFCQKERGMDDDILPEEK